MKAYRGVNVVIVEDDPYACDFMIMLLVRDWRTRVVANVHDMDEIGRVLNKIPPPDEENLFLIDTEVLNYTDWLVKIVGLIRSKRPDCFILCTGTKPDEKTLEQIIQLKLQGYVMKGEVSYGLGAAIRYAAKGKWVMTPSINHLADGKLPSSENKVVIRKRKFNLQELTLREEQFAKLCILFNLAHREIADDFRIETTSVRRALTKVYEKLHLWDVLEGDDSELNYLFDSRRILSFFKAAKEIYDKKRDELGNNRRPIIPDQSTLAFHLLTLVDPD